MNRDRSAGIRAWRFTRHARLTAKTGGARLDAWNHFESFVRITLAAATSHGMQYLLFAGVTWFACHVVLRSWWFRRKIVARYPRPGDYAREMLYSASSLVVFGAVGAATWLGSRAAGSPLRLYIAVSDYRWRPFGLFDDRGWTWFAVSLVLMIFIHDAYFCWTHRLMHHRRLFRLVHLRTTVRRIRRRSRLSLSAPGRRQCRRAFFRFSRC